jgi:peptidyl-Lys metalloendopeptidase
MRKSLIALLFLALSAAAVRAAELRADLTLSATWLGATDDVTATVTIANSSAQTVFVPRWLVPGAQLDADLFAVTRDGQPVTYLGRLVKRAAPGASDFVALGPGETLSGTTELTQHYDMAAGGEYVVAYRRDRLESIGGIGPVGASGASGAGGAFKGTAESAAVAVWREGPTSGPDLGGFDAPVGEGVPSTVNCSASETSAVNTALTNATNYASDSKSYLDARTFSTVGARYTTWFGAANSGRFSTVSSHYNAIRSAFQTAPVVVDCNCDEDYFAYVYPNQPYTIYVCNAFWSAPATGTDSKAGTLVHEMSHFNVVAGTDDHAYGQSACTGLAASQPSQAVDNADSHEYFAENTPPLEGGGGGAGSIRFQDGSKSVSESAGSVTLTARRINGSNGAVSVHYATANGTASAPSDYASASGTLSWANGDSSDKSFVVTVVNDSATEADETFTAALSAPTGGASLGSPSTATVTILDSDCTPSVCVPDANTLCLKGGSATPNRFRVRVRWTDFAGNTGAGVALSYTNDSGFFYFFNSQILELLVKIVNGCTLNNSYWFFYGSTSNVGLVYTVEDLQTCESKTVTVPVGEFASNGETAFFNHSCP